MLNKIVKYESRGALVEVTDSSFNIGKVKFTFAKYDTRTNKQEHAVDIYVDISKFLALCTMIENGQLERKLYSKPILDERNNEKPFWSSIGGSKGKARAIEIVRGQKSPYLLVGKEGEGQVNPKTNGIIMKGRPTFTVAIPVNNELINELKTVSAFITAYITAGLLNQKQLWTGTIKKIIIHSSLSGGDLNYELNWLANIDVQKTRNFNNTFQVDYISKERGTCTFIVRDFPPDMRANILARKDKMETQYRK